MHYGVMLKMSYIHITEFFKNSHIICAPVPAEKGQGVTLSLTDNSKPSVSIIETRQGWSVNTTGIGFSIDNYSQSYTEEEACLLAQGILNSIHLPLDPEDIEISTIRATGGQQQSITHIPTGLVKWIDQPTASGDIASKSKQDALDSLVFDLAMDLEYNQINKTNKNGITSRSSRHLPRLFS